MPTRSGLAPFPPLAARKNGARSGSGPKLPAASREARPMSHGRRGLAMFGVLIVLALAGGGYALARGTKSPAPLASEPSVANTIAAPGLVESAGGLREMAFQAPGRIKAVLVEEGQAAKKGQLLAELENDDAQASLNAAKAGTGVAEAQLSVLTGNLDAEEARAELEVERLKAELDRLKAGARKEEIDRARAETKAAEIEWKRRADDAKRYENYPSISSQQDREMTKGLAEITHAQFLATDAKQRELEAGTRKEDLAKAEALLKSAEADLERIRKTREVRLNVAKHQVEQAAAKVQASEADLHKTRLESPIDGVVVWRFRHPGETVGVLPPERVLTVADVRTLRVRADVDEADFAKIRPGQKVFITTEAYGNRAFTGRVERISHAAGQKRFSTGEAKERQDVKVVETLIAFDQPPPLKLGLRVTVAFELTNKE